MKKIYISGKITGNSYSLVYRRFEKVELFLASKGFEVINPLKNGIPKECDWCAHMQKDLQLLKECDFILFLPCWKNSTGSRIERKFAKKNGVKLIDLNLSSYFKS